MCVEKARQPEGLGRTELDPVLNESTAQNQVFHPRSERFERGVRGIAPQFGDLVVEEAGVDFFEDVVHDDETFDRFLQLHQFTRIFLKWLKANIKKKPTLQT